MLTVNAFSHNSTIADDEPAWSTVDKTRLPREAFADHGTPGEKSTWKYPHHWIKDGGNEDKNGVYTTGTMYLHVGGWQAAINAAHGARSGQRASQSVIHHLEGHRGAINRYRESKALSSLDTPRCWASHMGLWCIEPLWMQQAVTAIQSGLWMVQSEPQARVRQQERDYELYESVAVIPMHGPMMKAYSKFGGVSTVETRRMIRQAVRDPEVKTILLHIDSPGGHVAGTQELADEIYRTRSSGKQIVAHVDDLCASAAYWAASQTERITANPTAEIGSIGTIAVLKDTSQSMDRQGIQVHVISTGPFKGVGVDGMPISAEALDYLRQRVEDLNEHFVASVMRGREKSHDQLTTWTDGRMHIAKQAKNMGFLDEIMSLEEALDQAAFHPIYRASKASVPRATQSLKVRALQAFRQRQGV